MRLEEGRFYRTVNGRRVGPAKHHPHNDVCISWSLPLEGGLPMYYDPEGKICIDNKNWDIAAEWDDAGVVGTPHIATLRALAAERDAALARAEASEAEIERLREAREILRLCQRSALEIHDQAGRHVSINAHQWEALCAALKNGEE